MLGTCVLLFCRHLHVLCEDVRFAQRYSLLMSALERLCGETLQLELSSQVAPHTHPIQCLLLGWPQAIQSLFQIQAGNYEPS